MMSSWWPLLSFLLSILLTFHSSLSISQDPNGYIVYCPCMGRFGNQADHFLGALSFARGLNRTLILPPWVEYHRGKKNSIQVSFDTYFRVSSLLKYHRVITMEAFMEELAPSLWPPEERVVFCYAARRGEEEEGCNAKSGNPFGPFWDTHNIDFVRSEFYAPLSFSTHISSTAHQWNAKFPVSQYPVLAFTGAPAGFPVTETDALLHKHLTWSPLIENETERFIKEQVTRPFLAVHMRNGMDWRRACEHVENTKDRHLFASAQCLGHDMRYGQVTEEMCFPSDEQILKQITTAVKKIYAETVFVASDNDHMIGKITKQLSKFKTEVIKLDFDEPHVDLAILAQADHYIGNCVSTFSAFAVRERRANGKSVEFWAHKGMPHDEL